MGPSLVEPCYNGKPGLIFSAGAMMSNVETRLPTWNIHDPEAVGMVRLISQLRVADAGVDLGGAWSESLWRWIVDAGATLWSLAAEQGGKGCPRPLLVQRFAQLASGSLTAAFILSQHDAALKRLAAAAS